VETHHIPLEREVQDCAVCGEDAVNFIWDVLGSLLLELLSDRVANADHYITTLQPLNEVILITHPSA
jgi:hypothetical protein